jgi:hypothetical protein
MKGRGQLGRPINKWEYIIKLDLKEIGYDGVDWIHTTQDRLHWQTLVNILMNLYTPEM